ncbi:MAG: TIGR03016 family PEP-CTERM system-associated outer membrane protein, partial [Rhodothalassiaceae bacterium]
MAQTGSDASGQSRWPQGFTATLCCCLLALAGGNPAHALPYDQVPALPGGGTQAREVVGEGEGGYVYRIGPDDVLAVVVRDNPDLSRSYQVRPDGRFAMPLAGDIEAAGLTPDALARQIEKALERYIRNPVVTVTVSTASGALPDRIRIIGSGVTPQALPYRDGLTVRALLSEIGGLPPQADGNRAHLVRVRNGREERMALRLRDIANGQAPDQPILPGDVLVIPLGFFSGSLESSRSIGVAATYSDNLALAPKGQEDGTLISEIIPAFSMSLDGARVDAAIDAEVRLQYFADTPLKDFSVAPNVTASSNFEWVENLFFTDFSAAIHRQTIDSRLARSASNANTQNLDTVQTYRLSPYLRRALGDVATIEARYVGGLVFVNRSRLDQPGFPGNPNSLIGDSVQNTGELRIDSGPRFSRLTWSLFGTLSRIDPDNRPARNRREAILRTEFHLTPTFALVAEGGYQNFEGSDFGRTVDDPLYLGGIRWTPSPDTHFEALGGQRDGGDAIEVELEHNVNDALLIS